MKAMRFSRLASCIGALALLGALLGLLHLTLLDPYLAALEENSSKAVQLQALLTRYQKLADGLPDQRTQLEALRSDTAPLQGFLEGKSEHLAAAMLQEQLKVVAAGEGAHVASVQVLPDREEGRTRRITLRVRMMLDIVQLQRLLHAFETSRTALFIGNLEIRAVTQTRDRGDESGQLDVSFDLYGYMWRES